MAAQPGRPRRALLVRRAAPRFALLNRGAATAGGPPGSAHMSLTAKQRAFADAFISNGGNGPEAAMAAYGYFSSWSAPSHPTSPNRQLVFVIVKLALADTVNAEKMLAQLFQTCRTQLPTRFPDG